jgi:CRISPR-associated protein Cas2
VVSITIFIVENVPQSLRGELSRWMIEPKAGIFVGKISATVRFNLWEKMVKNVKNGGCIMIYTKNNEQGFAVASFGDTTRRIVDVEGLFLVEIPNQPN